ncbi:MAG TPA: SDR family NAD(P)-dependent oxidoreductase [Pseudonocardiaceae bacterium]
MGILDGRVVIVTGAGRGIGRGEALECARQGAAVVVAEFDEAAGRAVVDEITADGGRAVLAAGDVAETAVADGLVRTAVEAFGALDALVNNAGVLRDRTLVKMSDDEWDTVIRVHLRGHFLPTRAACRYWREADRPGRIVHTSSTSGILGNFGQANYGAAKAGIAALSTITAMEMARHRVTSNAIAPSAITRMTEDLLPEEVRLARKEAVDAGAFDFFAPENVAPLVAYLCSEASGHISGKVFGVQGDSVEIFQPFTSVAEVTNGGARWDPAVLAGRVDELFRDSGVQAGPENMMARMRYGILDHG